MTNKYGHSIKIGDRYHLDFQRNKTTSFELLDINDDGMAKLTMTGDDYFWITVDSLEEVEEMA